MKLYDFFRSSAAFRVRIALNLKRLSCERAFIHLRRNDQTAPPYLAVNPQGLVPALEEDGQVFTQSLAIIEYLDEVHPHPRLLPAEPRARARVANRCRCRPRWAESDRSPPASAGTSSPSDS